MAGILAPPTPCALAQREAPSHHGWLGLVMCQAARMLHFSAIERRGAGSVLCILSVAAVRGLKASGSEHPERHLWHMLNTSMGWRLKFEIDCASDIGRTFTHDAVESPWSSLWYVRLLLCGSGARCTVQARV